MEKKFLGGKSKFCQIIKQNKYLTSVRLYHIPCYPIDHRFALNYNHVVPYNQASVFFGEKKQILQL